MTRFREITISGDAARRGLIHGQALAEEIKATIAFYTSVFKMTKADIFERADHFRRVISAFNSNYAVEIEGIAEGAEVDPRWIYALNARTEILSTVSSAPPQECTALCFPSSRLLGQNWDWASTLEPLTVVMRIERPDGHVIRMITEPGIIGKIGMNSAGLGVCLNILTCERVLSGVPIHVMLRGVLDQLDLTSARALINRHAGGKASNMLLADASGQCADIEFADDRQFTLLPEKGVLIHTNHYLGHVINDADDAKFASSQARMSAAMNIADPKNKNLLAHFKALLSDQSNAELPIFRSYQPDTEIGNVGTVCSIIMELKKRKLHIRKGNQANAEFYEYEV